MGKYAATKATQNKQWKDVGRSAFGTNNSKGDYAFKSFLYGADPIGLYRGYVTSSDSTAYMSDYLANTGQDWSDIKYLSKSPGFGANGGFARSAMIFSSNIAKLYL